MATQQATQRQVTFTRDQAIEALGIAIRMKVLRFRSLATGRYVTDQEIMDEAVGYVLDPTSNPHLPFLAGSGTGWEKSADTNPYRYWKKTWFGQFWSGTGIDTSSGVRLPAGWVHNLDKPTWRAPWPHEPGRPDRPLL